MPRSNLIAGTTFCFINTSTLDIALAKELAKLDRAPFALSVPDVAVSVPPIITPIKSSNGLINSPNILLIDSHPLRKFSNVSLFVFFQLPDDFARVPITPAIAVRTRTTGVPITGILARDWIRLWSTFPPIIPSGPVPNIPALIPT